MTEWRKRCLGEITSFMSKGIPPKYVERENENTVRVLNQKCNRNFEIKYEESRLHDCSKKKVPADKMLQPGDVLINSTGTGTAGRVAQLYDVPTPTTIDGHMILLRPTEGIDSIYYGYAIKAFQPKIETLAEGSTGQTEINRKRLQEEIVISFPKGKETQERIARFLLNIDEKIKVNGKINKNLEQQAQTLFDHFYDCLSGQACTLSEIIDIRDGTHDSPKATDNGYPLITSKHLLPFGVDTSSANIISKADYDKVNERSNVNTGDILISMIGTVGLISYVIDSPVEFAIKNVGLFKTSQHPSLDLYILYYLKSISTTHHIERCLAGSTQKYISLGELRKLPILVPSQQELDVYNSVVRPIVSEIILLVQENRRLSNIRDLLLPKLMTGELDVSDIDL